MLEGIEKVTGVAAAHRCFSITRTILSWQSARDDDFKSPIRRGMWEAPDNQHSRTLTDAKLKAVWDAATDRAGASQRWPSSTTCAQRGNIPLPSLHGASPVTEPLRQAPWAPAIQANDRGTLDSPRRRRSHEATAPRAHSAALQRPNA
jgi:hypothetical protein